MSEEKQTLNIQERDVMRIMRKVLSSVIKDTTPPSRAMKHPLSDDTIQDIRHCLGLITYRERELADAEGIKTEKPYFTDDVEKVAEVISINKIGRVKKDDA